MVACRRGKAPEETRKRRHPALCFLLRFLFGFLLLAGASFLFYINDYYRADAAAQVAATDGLWEEEASCYRHRGSGEQPLRLIFYPGGKVEERAYLPFLEQIVQRRDLDVILVKMPCRLAVLDIHAAARYWEDGARKRTVLAGHSLGGAMASLCAARHPDRAAALILLGAYPYGKYEGATLALVGSLEQRIREKNERAEVTQLTLVTIPGGNHAQFGNYGAQKGDPPAEIPREEQQRQAAQAIADFLDRLSTEGEREAKREARSENVADSAFPVRDLLFFLHFRKE